MWYNHEKETFSLSGFSVKRMYEEDILKQIKNVTVKDIAKRLGVSLSTVNKALTGKSGISEARRAEIIAVADEMGYVVNHVAQALSRKPINIGVIIPSLWQQYFASIEHGLRMELDKLAHSNVTGSFKYVSSEKDIKTVFEELYNEKVDVILYCPSLLGITDEAKTVIALNGSVPVFTVGDKCRDLDEVCSVTPNSRLSGYMVADLFSAVLGKKAKVAVFIGSHEHSSHVEKVQAFSERAKRLGIELVKTYETYDDHSTASECVCRLQKDCPDINGIYIATGIAGPVLDFFKNREREHCPYIVTTDLYDEIRQGVNSGYIGATVFQNQVLMGRLAVKKAYNYIVEKYSYKNTSNELPKTIYISPRLFMPSSVEEFTFDYGNEYTVE